MYMNIAKKSTFYKVLDFLGIVTIVKSVLFNAEFESVGSNRSLQKRAKPSYLAEINKQNSIMNIA